MRIRKCCLCRSCKLIISAKIGNCAIKPAVALIIFSDKNDGDGSIIFAVHILIYKRKYINYCKFIKRITHRLTLTLICGVITGVADCTIGKISRNTRPGFGSVKIANCANMVFVNESHVRSRNKTAIAE